MRLYTCPISASFLRTFEYPEPHGTRNHSHPRSKHISHTSIKYQKIAFKPYSTLRQRILEEIAPLITDQKKKAEDEEEAASEKMTLSGMLFNL